MKVLFVTQEMNPYTALSEVSEAFKSLPQYIQEQDYEIRVLMPRFGTINERRHRLHEVVRLSGMNIIVDDEDYPLIIKVASIPGSRLQVYFLDNEEFFKRKHIFDNEGEVFEDNYERLIFFCKGAMETVKKFGWPPDIIHCHGSFTSLIPLYTKKVYNNDPIFSNSKVLYSAYTDVIGNSFNLESFKNVAAINDLEAEDLDAYHHDGKVDLNLGALHFSDGVLVGSSSISEAVIQAAEKEGKPVIDVSNDEKFLKSTAEFYKKFIEQEPDEA